LATPRATMQGFFIKRSRRARASRVASKAAAEIDLGVIVDEGGWRSRFWGVLAIWLMPASIEEFTA
jgi:hypothetical protein